MKAKVKRKDSTSSVLYKYAQTQGRNSPIVNNKTTPYHYSMNSKIYLFSLAKQILNVNNESVPKVRFAKLIYLTHKGLVQSSSELNESLKFVRMPLGPVPFGFDVLLDDKNICMETQSIGLTYNRESYSLKAELKKNKLFYLIKDIVNNLRTVNTSDLIEYTHQEPSWMKYPNGHEYYIENDDLKRKLPHASEEIDRQMDEQRTQGLLIKGMIDEIVAESTALEYPEFDK